MPKVVVDQRIRISKLMLKEAFIRILTEKPIKKITIKEICDSANINRGTFYNHYEDVYGLLDEIVDDFLGEITDIVKRSFQGWQDNFYKLCLNLFTFLVQNKDFVVPMLKDNSDDGIASRFVKNCRSEFINKYKDLVKEPDYPLLDNFYYFVGGGCWSLIKQWFATGNAVPIETMAKDCGNLISFGWVYLTRKMTSKPKYTI